MLRFALLAVLVAGSWVTPGTAAVAQEQVEPKAAIEGQGAAGRQDSVSRGYYANYSPNGFFPHYVSCPNYPAKYPPLLGYGFGWKGHMLYHPAYIHGHPAGYLRENCPNDCKYGPVYYQSGMPVSGSKVEWLHY